MLDRRLAILLLAPVLIAGKCRKDKGVDGEDTDVAPPPPSQKLQVAGIDPTFGPPQREFRAEVFGAGFQNGARVDFSGIAAAEVDFNDAVSLLVVVPALNPGSYDVRVVNPDGSSSTLRGGLSIGLGGDADTGPACAGGTVWFAFDSSVLSAESRATLDRIGQCLRETGGALTVEGHCDERGTTEYNLALGQRRADSVKRYLTGLGIPPSKVRTVSYGEEQPVDPAHNESAWSRNRRAELRVP